MAKHLEVRTNGAESLMDIASVYTLSPAYYTAIANYNGLDSFQADPGYRFPAGETIAIPVEWLKPEFAAQSAGRSVIAVVGASGTAPARPAPGAAQGFPWLPMAAGLAVIAIVLMDASGRKRNRR